MSEVAAELAEQTWPDFYPKGVPPKTAVDAEGEFYRLVRANPPTPNCFLSTHEEYPNRHKKCRGEALQCVYGTSFFSEERGATDAKAKFPAALGDRTVAKGNVMPFMGVMKKTFADPAHYTIWLTVNCSIHEHFACLGEGE
ncbi:hypothetical protein WAF85_003741 [Salmonella enterica]|uniref:Uncharacterized protein n=1 Tax=Salmonella enterica subsp. enterica serovar Tennessee TaxID=143221 RepID=A0A8E6TXF3_SALET|nr:MULTISPECIES: hypothetical protein [Enterobacteriaceae]EAB4958752.1 hypothetical protein [Salmonella enterica]EBQ8796559.1 hypothetical protein [Salmonella enterica subsp. enterica]ECB7205362.1 hypothetical protein [Salmonella enterica subsp. enterica serovar Abaetetuba]ECC2872207.1 hypothetical protein [Salmonella enterica subsp. enterica serovar Tanger]EDX4410886.1 hypothetical protein [Salmonella enterica subsp. houtenae serovar 44:z36,[z38]:-]EEJ2455464.1 hypothetical protein [Salmonel